MLKSEENRDVSGCDPASVPDHAGTDPDMATSDSTRGKSPAFQFYPKDFLLSRKVRNMSLTERGAYITLLSIDWMEGGLPTDLDQLAKDLDVPTQRFRKMWSSGPLHECFVEKNGRLTNPRLQEERRKQAEYRRRQADNGAKGGRPKVKGLGSSGKPTEKPAHETHSEATKSSASSSLFASASSPSGESTERSRPIVQRIRKDAAFEYGRLYVPQRAHDDLMMLANHGQSEKPLRDWYLAICEEYTSGAKANAALPTNMIEFWKAKYAIRWPPEPVAPPSSNQPAWIAAAKAKAAHS